MRDFGNRRGGGGDFRRRSFGPREMHKAVCSGCGKECEVPFRPAQDRPVYCKECFMKRKEEGEPRMERKPREEPREEFDEELEEVAEDTAEEEEAQEEEPAEEEPDKE